MAYYLVMQSTTNLPIRSTLFRFHSLANAQSFANRGKALMVVLGDHAEFWVVTMADAMRLEKAGYELA